MIEKKFNPFYDSHFLISYDEDGKLGTGRYLVELYPEELMRLSFEIECVMRNISDEKLVKPDTKPSLKVKYRRK